MGRRQRLIVLGAAFLGWMFAGVEMSILVPATQPAIREFLGSPVAPSSTLAPGANAGAEINAEAKRLAVLSDVWLSRYLTAFLLGAAVGGALFGWLADRFGRVRALGGSILCYSLLTGLSYFATGPWQLLALRFAACMGIGGLWPAAVALVSEAWPNMSRPRLAGLIGASANVGFLLLGIIMIRTPITTDSWRWVFLLGGAPVILAVAVLWIVPESPAWLESCHAPKTARSTPLITEVFQPPLLRLTCVGIALGTIPLLAGWGSGQRLVPWAGQVGVELKAWTQIVHSSGAVLGSLGGGWLAVRLGARASYFAISLGSLALSLLVFFGLRPGGPGFLPCAFALGLVSTAFYGWLPWFLPGLFPTHVRATGAGVSFNWGRILSAAAVAASAPLSRVFGGDIGLMAGTLSGVYALGMALAFVIPAAADRS